MNKFMKKAVELAVDNVKDSGQPFGAVLVKDNKIITEGVNELHQKYDVSAHAEMVAVRKAQKELKTQDLSGYQMYASGHPCSMCLTALYFVGIDEVYYCADLEDVKKAGMSLSGKIYADLQKANKDREIVMKVMPLEKGMTDPMRLWEEKSRY